MHLSVIFLALVSVVLIIIMLACFICFTRSRRKEERELMEQVQFTTQHQTNQHIHNPLDPMGNSQQLTVTPMRNPSQTPRISATAANNLNSDLEDENMQQQNRQSRSYNNNHQNYYQNLHSSTQRNSMSNINNESQDDGFANQQQDQMIISMGDYRNQANSARQQQQQQQQHHQQQQAYMAMNASPYHQAAQSTAAMTETRNDITQQINSAIIGSTEAEFQNDFIQVFPMYQIAPLPEKNSTPYMT